MPITYQTAGLAAALGVGLAVAAGCGLASAESNDSGSSPDAPSASQQSHPSRTPGVKAGKVAASRGTLTSVAVSPTPEVEASDVPSAPLAGSVDALAVRGVLKPAVSSAANFVRTIPVRSANPVVTLPNSDDADGDSDGADAGSSTPESDTDAPSPDDMTETQYGDIGDWMLQPNGQIADWIGHSLDGKTLLEPVNVIIIDPTTAPLDKAVMRLNRAMTMAGFPGVIFHSGGYQGLINGDAYQQQPVGTMLGFSDAFFLLPNNHGRIFGPYVMPGGGYMWTAALSREELGDYEGELTHVFVSFNEARDALRAALVERTGATDLGDVLMDTVYHSDTITTGDSDGHTAVIQLSL